MCDIGPLIIWKEAPSQNWVPQFEWKWYMKYFFKNMNMEKL